MFCCALVLEFAFYTTPLGGRSHPDHGGQPQEMLNILRHVYFDSCGPGAQLVCAACSQSGVLREPGEGGGDWLVDIARHNNAGEVGGVSCSE